jgi:hypothetical protein
MTATAQNPTLRRAAGDHTVFLGDPIQETLFSMVVALLGELSIVRDRLDAHERLMKKAGLPLSPPEVDGFAIDEAVATQRATTRDRMIRHVFRALHEKLPPTELRAQTESYAGIFAEVQQNDVAPDSTAPHRS